MKTITLKPGSIMLWKEHTRLTNWLHKLFRIKTSYNQVSLLTESIEMYIPITEGKAFLASELIILEPKVDFTKEEIAIMDSLTYYQKDTWFDHIKIFVNTARPNTIDTSSKIDDLLFNENYKVAYDFSKKN